MSAAAKSLPLAVAWMCGAILCFLLSAIAGRELSREIGAAQIVALRNILCLAILAAILARLGWSHARSAKPARHLLRSVIHFAAQFGWYYAIARIAIAEVFAIEFTAPIWTALLAALFLGERLTATRVIAIALGFAGVLVILRPGMSVVDPAALVALGAAFGYAVTYIFTKDLVATDRPLAILLWMNVIQLPLALAASASSWVTPSVSLWPWVGVTGLVGLTSHYCLARALEHGEAAVVTPLDFLRLPLAAVVAWLLYGERVDPWVFVGATIIFCGICLNLRRA